MSEFRKLQPLKIRPRDMVRPWPAGEIGRPATLAMLPTTCLVVDERYQRPIVGKGKHNIIRILEEFDWRKFMPLVVVPIGDGTYAVIDGQHRATAALLHPAVDAVPAMIVEATVAEAAAIFVAVNATTTGVNLSSTFRARVEAGEAEAGAIAEVCHRAGVVVRRTNPTGSGAWGRGETVAVGALTSIMRQHGEAMLETVLRGLVESGDGHPGLLSGVVLKALAAVIAETGASLDQVKGALGQCRLFRQIEAASKAKSGSQVPLYTLLAARLRPFFLQAVRESAAETGRQAEMEDVPA